MTIAHRLEIVAAMREGPLPNNLSSIIGQAHIMLLARPIDASVPLSLVGHGSLHWLRRATATRVIPVLAIESLTSHGTLIAAILSGHRSSPGARSTGANWLLPTGGPAPPVYPSDWRQPRKRYRGPYEADRID